MFGDGSVRFISSTINPQTLRALATAQGQEAIADPDFDGGAFAVQTQPSGKTGAVPSLPMAEAPRPAAKAEAKAAEPAATQTAPMPAEKPAEKSAPVAPASTPPPTPTPGGDRARLSLGVVIETGDVQPVRFRREGGPGELVVGLQDSRFADALQWFLLAGWLLAAWIWRRAPGPRRAIALVLGLAVPIGLSGLIPLAWTPLLDGLLLGVFTLGVLNRRAGQGAAGRRDLFG